MIDKIMLIAYFVTVNDVEIYIKQNNQHMNSVLKIKKKQV